MTNGLRRIGHFEAVLAAANRDEAHIDGIINPYLANAATRIINSPDFQRVKDRAVDDLQEKEIKHLETKRFEHNVTNLAVDARVNRADLDYIITNLQQPPPPPPPPPPSQPRDDAANRASIIAELDGIAIQRDKDMRAQMIAQQNARDLAAQRIQTPIQQIIHQYHYQPAPQPIIVQPDMSNLTEMMRHYGESVQQVMLRQQPREEIPITMLGGQGPPPPPPGAGAIAMRSGYGPARMPPERYAPFASSQGPPPPGGGTAPMPIRAALPARPATAPGRNPIPVKKAEKPKPKKKKVEEEIEVETGGNNPPTAPSAGAARIRAGKRGPGDDYGDGPAFSRFTGRGQKLPADSFPAAGRGPSATAGSLGVGGKRAAPVLAVRAGYQPFAGQAQRLDGPAVGGGLREKAAQRMREIGHQHAQKERKSEMLDRQNDMQRAIRRGGAQGDVVPLGKRKRESQDAFVPRRRTGDRPTGPQRFRIG
jgi:hypothetical protein